MHLIMYSKINVTLLGFVVKCFSRYIPTEPILNNNKAPLDYISQYIQLYFSDLITMMMPTSTLFVLYSFWHNSVHHFNKLTGHLSFQKQQVYLMSSQRLCLPLILLRATNLQIITYSTTSRNR